MGPVCVLWGVSHTRFSTLAQLMPGTVLCTQHTGQRPWGTTVAQQHVPELSDPRRVPLA